MDATRTAAPVERDGRASDAPARTRPKPAGGWSWKPVLVLLLLAGVVGALFVAGLVPRLRAKRAAEAAKAPAGPPAVNVVTAEPAPAEEAVTLPGTTRAFEETAVLARTSGYLEKWVVEMGDRVRADQLMGVIATPELDRELDQARAARSQALASLEQVKATLLQNEANQTVAKANFGRVRGLSGRGGGGSISQSEFDQADGALKVADATVASGKANVQAAEANARAADASVKRLEQLQSFQQVKAPFAGVVTARNVDTGALITAGQLSGTAPAGSNQTGPGGATASAPAAPAARELFRVARTDPLRVNVYVPQAFAALVKVGQGAELTVKESPGKGFAATVTRTANELDPATRTLLTEVQVPNPDRALLPGLYAQVRFTARRDKRPVVVPGGALLTRPDHLVVAVVGDGDAVRYQRVEVSRDFGGRAEVSVGLTGGERVAVNLAEDYPEGTVVKPVPLPAQPDAKK